MRSDHLTNDDGRVIQFRPRMGTSPRGRGGKAPIRNFERDYSPVPIWRNTNVRKATMGIGIA